MESVTCSASNEAAANAQFEGLCFALSQALAAETENELAVHFVRIAANGVEIQISDLTRPETGPIPMSWSIQDRDLAPEHHSQFAVAIANSALRQGILNPN